MAPHKAAEACFRSGEELQRSHASETSLVEKTYRRGTHRLVSPVQTVERIEPYLQSFGITRVANITDLDKIGLPVVAVYRPNARSLAVSQGKGLDLAAAKASGIMEAIEGYHAEHVKLPLRLASFSEISQDGAVLDVGRLPHNSARSLDLNRQILWCEGRDLVSDCSVWVPYEMVHTNFTLPLSGSSGHFQMSSNGLSSGNCWQEAVSHGICELVERDALALWSARGATADPKGALDLSSVDDPDCLEVIKMLRDAGQAVGVWSITTDIGLPTFACTIADFVPNHLGQYYASDGSGCHSVREIALLRALTEAAQTRLTFIAGARDDAHRDFFEVSRNRDRVETIRKRIGKCAELQGLSFKDVPSFDGESFEEDITHQIAQLRAVGIEQVALVNLGGYVDGIEVVRVVIPGLEGLHDAPGYVPGKRLKLHSLDLAGGA
ncbi:YcaO-like family protein [Pseudovibrio sp. W64]|uniref:YcaO-like family protein n=1 Tax=unclassified Pseudovibrio TaxID=2627060 RepID=UPI0007B2D358|nr:MULTISPECIES: YcaO-like family protein [unclassified Pseudovibrio]KZK86783.1 YcaO-like family protein [Pseudovibrio sp. W64]KZK89704.1 YcaO-like family protein [Pseudovibrio sp. Ad5]